MSRLDQFLFGRASFLESEEYLEFQYRFLIVLLVSGAAFTFLFLVGAYSDVNRMDSPHLLSMSVFTAMALLLWLALRGRKHWFRPVAWIYLTTCMLEYVSALLLVPTDELRVLWFYINIPGVYILLGQRIGMLITVGSAVGLILLNRHLTAPYSPNAMATGIIAMLYLGMFFHVYANRSISYFKRMRESNQRLRVMAMHDALTGVMNARAYYGECDRLIHLAQRADAPYAVLFVDLDHFKSINDTHGHAAGDLVLKAVADCLGRRIRRSDVLGRIGGEEFSIFLPDTDAADALQLAEALRQSIEELRPDIPGQRLRITASIGVARNQRADQSIQDIQQQADQAMYRAKAGGRNRVSAVDAAAAPLSREPTQLEPSA